MNVIERARAELKPLITEGYDADMAGALTAAIDLAEQLLGAAEAMVAFVEDGRGIYYAKDSADPDRARAWTTMHERTGLLKAAIAAAKGEGVQA